MEIERITKSVVSKRGHRLLTEFKEVKLFGNYTRRSDMQTIGEVRYIHYKAERPLRLAFAVNLGTQMIIAEDWSKYVHLYQYVRIMGIRCYITEYAEPIRIQVGNNSQFKNVIWGAAHYDSLRIGFEQDQTVVMASFEYDDRAGLADTATQVSQRMFGIPNCRIFAGTEVTAIYDIATLSGEPKEVINMEASNQLGYLYLYTQSDIARGGMIVNDIISMFLIKMVFQLEFSVPK